MSQVLVFPRVNWTLPPKRGECKFIDAGNLDAAVTELLSLLKMKPKYCKENGYV